MPGQPQKPKTIAPKTIALFGGSFNPPHDAHFAMAAHVYDTIKPDEIWMMFSVNRLKDPSVYAPLHHRMKMGDIVAKHFPDTPFRMSDIEDKVGTNQTFFILKRLRDDDPDIRFVWVMGADNLIGFEKWSHADEIFENFPIVIIDRPPYTAQAMQSPIIKKFETLKCDDPADIVNRRNGWALIGNPSGLSLSSTDLLNRMRAGERRFSGAFNDVAAYIRQNGLYGMTPDRPRSAPPAPRPHGP